MKYGATPELAVLINEFVTEAQTALETPDSTMTRLEYLVPLGDGYFMSAAQFTLQQRKDGREARHHVTEIAIEHIEDDDKRAQAASCGDEMPSRAYHATYDHGLEIPDELNIGDYGPPSSLPRPAHPLNAAEQAAYADVLAVNDYACNAIAPPAQRPHGIRHSELKRQEFARMLLATSLQSASQLLAHGHLHEQRDRHLGPKDNGLLLISNNWSGPKRHALSHPDEFNNDARLYAVYSDGTCKYQFEQQPNGAVEIRFKAATTTDGETFYEHTTFREDYLDNEEEADTQLHEQEARALGLYVPTVEHVAAFLQRLRLLQA